MDARAMAEEWLQLDKDPASRAQIAALLEQGALLQLEDLVGRRLQFGTAGLRERMGPGFNRMNAITVQQTTQGLCRYLQKHSHEQLRRKGIIIGYDARHHSQEFAHVAARVFVREGVRVHLFGRPVPTPYVAAGALQMGCAAAIVITASHNTKEYNGYKLYWSNACQIIPPHDANIAASILDNLQLWDLPAGDTREWELVSDPFADVCWYYYSQLKKQLCFEADNTSNARVVYTPLHGVGLRPVQLAFQVFGLPAPYVVAEQAQPDPDFPTVSFPNPEEGAGTWDLAFKTAMAQGAQLVLANDPDADRLAAAERCDSAPGGFRAFSGNEMGLLLAHWVWTSFRQRNPDVPPERCAMLSTAVSSRSLAAMAAVEGFHYQETLTGFKWLSNVAEQLEEQGYTVLFAYEEAIGFMFPGILKYLAAQDKDGIAAAAVFAEMAGALARRGVTVQQHLQSLYQRYGHFVDRSSYFLSPSATHSQAVFSALRAQSRAPTSSRPDASSYPQQIGGAHVTGIRDLGTGLDTTQPDGQAVLPWNSGDMMVTFTLEPGQTSGAGKASDAGDCKAVLTLRASATEPKLKWYLCVEALGKDARSAQALASALEAAVDAELVQPDLNGLARRPVG